MACPFLSTQKRKEKAPQRKAESSDRAEAKGCLSPSFLFHDISLYTHTYPLIWTMISISNSGIRFCQLCGDLTVSALDLLKNGSWEMNNWRLPGLLELTQVCLALCIKSKRLPGVQRPCREGKTASFHHEWADWPALEISILISIYQYQC